MPKDPGLAAAVENLRRDRPGAEADISMVADFLHRNEISLLALKRAGLPGPVIDAYPGVEPFDTVVNLPRGKI